MGDMGDNTEDIEDMKDMKDMGDMGDNTEDIEDMEDMEDAGKPNRGPCQLPLWTLEIEQDNSCWTKTRNLKPTEL